MGEGLEGTRRHYQRGRAGPLERHRVVETPRRAGPSVGGAGDDQIDVAEAREDLRRGGRRTVRLPLVDDLRELTLGSEARLHAAEQQLEVRLRVVEESEPFSGQRAR